MEEVFSEQLSILGSEILCVSYNKLFKLLIDKGWRKTEFAKNVGINANTLAKLSRNEMVSLKILVRICRGLGCKLEEVVEVLPETVQ